MTNNRDTGCANQPEHRGKRRGPETKRNGNDEEGGVELRGRGSPAAELKIIALEFANTKHTSNYKTDDKKKQQVGEQTVDAEHDEDGGIVAGEVAQVVVDPALDLAEVGGLGDALEVEELGDGSQVGEARGDRGGAQAVEASAEIHPRRQGVDGNAEARHDGRSGGGGGGGGGSWRRRWVR